MSQSEVRSADVEDIWDVRRSAGSLSSASFPPSAYMGDTRPMRTERRKLSDARTGGDVRLALFIQELFCPGRDLGTGKMPR